MKPNDLLILISCCVLSAVLAVAGAYAFLAPASAPADSDASSLINPRLEELRLRTFASSAPTNFITAAENVTPAVVFIRCFGQRTSRMEPNVESSTTGSGVIIDPRG